MENEEIDKKLDALKDTLSKVLVDLITDIPESLHCETDDPDTKVKKLTQQAALKAATFSATLSIPAGLTGVLTTIPDMLAVWKIQAQLVSDIAATYGKIALLSQEAMIWCLFRHSAASLLRDVAVRTGSRVIIQKVSFAALEQILQKIGIQVSTKFLGRAAVKAIPFLGAVGNGAYTYYDTNEVGKTAATYFKSLVDNKVEPMDAEIVQEDK